MEQNIREYMEELFESAPNTRKAAEMKLELTENLIEKYQGLLSEGKTPEDAYNITLMSIGDVSELFDSLRETPATMPQEIEQERKRSAFLITVAVMVYILSLVPVIIFGGKFSIVIMLIMIAAATGLIVYTQMTKARAQYYGEDNVVADFRNWQNKNQNNKQLRNSLIRVLWPLTVVVYFLVSFGTMRWWITWVIFPLSVAVQGIISIMFSDKQ